MVLNEFYTNPEVYDLAMLGIEGKHWEAVGDDQYKIIDESGYGVSSNCNWGWNNADLTRTEYIEDRTALDDKYDEMKAEWEANIKPAHVLEGFTFDNTNVASQVAAVEANIETYYNPLVNGLVDDVDATIEQFRAALESAGIQDVLDELERQKEEFIAFNAAIELLKEKGQEKIIEEVYRKCKEQQGRPKEEIINYVKEIYAPFTDDDISARIVEMVRPQGSHIEIEIVYQTIKNLHRACEGHAGDWYFSGNYPTPGGNRLVNNAFIHYYENIYTKK